MIQLDLLDACHTCLDFKPVKTNCHTLMYGDEVMEITCDITCENIGKCRALLKHLQKEEKKNG